MAGKKERKTEEEEEEGGVVVVVVVDRWRQKDYASVPDQRGAPALEQY